MFKLSSNSDKQKLHSQRRVSWLEMENVSYHLDHNLVSSNTLLKNILIQMQKNYNFTC